MHIVETTSKSYLDRIVDYNEPSRMPTQSLCSLSRRRGDWGWYILVSSFWCRRCTICYTRTSLTNQSSFHWWLKINNKEYNLSLDQNINSPNRLLHISIDASSENLVIHHANITCRFFNSCLRLDDTLFLVKVVDFWLLNCGIVHILGILLMNGYGN